MNLLKANKQLLGSQHPTVETNSKLTAMTSFKIMDTQNETITNLFVCVCMCVYVCKREVYTCVHTCTLHTHKGGRVK